MRGGERLLGAQVEDGAARRELAAALAGQDDGAREARSCGAACIERSRRVLNAPGHRDLDVVEPGAAVVNFMFNIAQRSSDAAVRNSRFVTVSAAGQRSFRRSDDGQTILG